jgi:hypothetical protein
MELRVHTDRAVMENRPDTIIKNKRGENMQTDRSSNTFGQKYHAEGSRKERKKNTRICV